MKYKINVPIIRINEEKPNPDVTYHFQRLWDELVRLNVDNNAMSSEIDSLKKRIVKLETP
jgi:hypothetical protein